MSAELKQSGVWINLKGIQSAGLFQLVTTIMKVTPLIIIGLAGLFFIEMDNFFPINVGGVSDFRAITASATLTFSAFGAMALSFVFIELSKVFPNKSGGPYTYSRKGLGDFAGMRKSLQWGYWISVWSGKAQRR